MRDRPTILVVIASFGIANDRYLSRVLAEYRSMPYRLDITVVSNVHKYLGDDIRVVVGLPSKDPRSLPFAHKQIFADHMDEYDLFVYSEDDMLITRRHIEAFVGITDTLRDDEIAGFLRFERGPDGSLSYPDIHQSYHWDSSSLRVRGGHTYAYFTNEHSAAYILTQSQLRRAIDSGGFLTEPYEAQYEMLETAATDPYTRCGMQKLICLSRIDDFLIQHLPNKYVGRLGIGEAEFRSQMAALLNVSGSRTQRCHPFPDHSGGNLYESVRWDLIELLPAQAHNILSVGCGLGSTEMSLVSTGKRVVAIPRDPFISAHAATKGVEVIAGCDLRSAAARLRGQKFDAIVFFHVLQFVNTPLETLSMFAPLLAEGALVIAVERNLTYPRLFWKRLRRLGHRRAQYDMRYTCNCLTSSRAFRRLFCRAGLRLDRLVYIPSRRKSALFRGPLAYITRFLSPELITLATH